MSGPDETDPNEEEIVIEVDPSEAVSGPSAARVTSAAASAAQDIAPADDEAATALRGQVDRLTAEVETEKRKAETARSAAADAQARADQAARMAAETRRAAQEDQTRSIASRKQSIETETAALEENLAVAYASQDYSQVAKLQRKMTALEVERQAIEQGSPSPPLTEGRVVREPERQPPRGADLVEGFAATLDPAAAAWIRAHPEYVTDHNKNVRMRAHHALVVADGFTASTPEYFAEMEKRLGMTKNGSDVEGGKSAAASPAARSSMPARPAAPVGGSSNGASAVGKTKVTLSKSEFKTATDGTLQWGYDDPTGKKRWRKGDPIGAPEYARRKAAQMAEGKFETPYVQQ